MGSHQWTSGSLVVKVGRERLRGPGVGLRFADHDMTFARQERTQLNQIPPPFAFPRHDALFIQIRYLRFARVRFPCRGILAETSDGQQLTVPQIRLSNAGVSFRDPARPAMAARTRPPSWPPKLQQVGHGVLYHSDISWFPLDQCKTMSS